MKHNTTIAALATAQGLGAIGIIRLSGGDALHIANRIFAGADLVAAATHTTHFGRIVNNEKEVIDEVLATVFVAPRSYTKENVVELSCHNSPYILQQVIDLCLQHGAVLALPGEFTQRAFVNGALDLTQAEAVADLIAADSSAAHRLALQQMRGSVSSALDILREKLINFAALIELELDFGEEDVAFANRHELYALVQEILANITQLIQTFALGNALKNGVPTAIVGKPNAGKSTLLNALLGEERAIVSSIAGTTRDTIQEVLNIKGVAFRLIDTAGIRQTTNEIEAIGVQKTMEMIHKAALIIYMYDAQTDALAEVKMAVEAMQKEVFDKNTLVNDQQPAPQYIICANKIDGDGVIINDETVVQISAKECKNLEILQEKMLVAIGYQKHNPNQLIITNLRHKQALAQASEALHSVLAGLDTGVSSDFLAMDIRFALQQIGVITGKIDIDKDILGTIFGKFCIGK